MSETDIRKLIDLIRFDDPAHVAMLSDALIDAGREREAELLRSMHGLPRKDWNAVCVSIARDAIREFSDELYDVLIQQGELPRYFNMLPDRLSDQIDDRMFEDERWNRTFDTLAAAEILSQLNSHLETDSGLWQRQEPEEALSSQAGWTMRNAANHYANELLVEINYACEDLVEQMNESEDAGNDSDVERLRGEIREEIVNTIKEWK